jgi:hypothetical protein
MLQTPSRLLQKRACMVVFTVCLASNPRFGRHRSILTSGQML